MAVLVLILSGAAAHAQCTIDNNGTAHGEMKRTEFHQGLTILTYNPCGQPNVDLEVKPSITHDKNDQGADQTHWNYNFVDRRTPDVKFPVYEFIVTRMDGSNENKVLDAAKIFAELDKLRSGDRFAKDAKWQLVSDKSAPWGGVSWLTARTVTYRLPSHQDGFYPPDTSGNRYPRWVAATFITFRQIVDTRHQLLYVLYARGVSDGLDWMETLSVAP
ncbi:MAG TPA: hypothetical protein VFR84_13270 [Candidatus Angelobacter sp.]|nr:hypothetical protein [Candidatus Angelobacter sp.]